MATIEWNDRRPVRKERLRELGPFWRSQKTAFRTAMEDHFFWSDSTLSAGEPRASTTTPGAARFYYDARSAVSDPARPGAAMLLSDESRLLGFNSNQSTVIGSASMMVGRGTGEVLDGRTNCVRVVFGGSQSIAADDVFVEFPSAFSDNAQVAPLVWITPGAANISDMSYVAAVSTVSTSGFISSVAFQHGGADPATANIHWYSEGTLPL